MISQESTHQRPARDSLAARLARGAETAAALLLEIIRRRREEGVCELPQCNRPGRRFQHLA